MKTVILAAPVLALCVLTAAAQQTHHSATTVHRRVTTPAVHAGPALPPGVPPANGKLETAFALRYIDITPGVGPVVEPGQFYTVQYTGWLASDGTKFDSSLDRSEPFTFPQGMHRVIPGWDGGFEGMRVGGKRRLFIPYQLAYGERGRPPVIPAKSDLIFDIELVSAGTTPPEPPAPPTPPPAEQAPSATPPPAQPQQPQQ